MASVHVCPARSGEVTPHPHSSRSRPPHCAPTLRSCSFPRQVRVYTKKVGAKPDFAEPVVLTQDRGGTTVEALCRQVSFVYVLLAGRLHEQWGVGVNRKGWAAGHL